jgi:hypothetical protein
MTTLQFDEYGLLVPYQMPIEVDLATLEHYFVASFPHSVTRKNIFINYVRYIEEFKKRVTSDFVQWLNGSFVTLKENPKDLDLVTFFDYQIFEQEGERLDRFWTFSLEDKGLDAYLVATYPPNHPKHIDFLEDKRNWLALYSKTKAIDTNPLKPKGFLQIVL